ncbi:hypothetical protein [Streptomyces sp. DW26H14]|uniref:hypothetical protein n=1 Tax=Streptomyces sp. DW26H14 TaxID=3435395 RepID=UPI00403DD856
MAAERDGTGERAAPLPAWTAVARTAPAEGGESACMLELVCQDCGQVRGDTGATRACEACGAPGAGG